MQPQEEDKTPLELGRGFLSQFKQMAHDAKDLVERLAEIQFKIEEDLKQKDIAERTGELFDTENQFLTQVDALVHDYEIELNRQEQEAD